MNILWSIHLYPPKHNCGSEFVAHHVNKFLISKGHRIKVALHYAQRNGIKVDYDYEGVYCMVGKDCTRVDTYRWPDMILTHLDCTQYTIVMAAEARKPMVHFVHNDIPYQSILGSPGASIVYNSSWIASKIGYKHFGYILHPPCDYDYYSINEYPINSEYITLISLNERKGGQLFGLIARAMPDRKFLGVIGSYDNPGALGMDQASIINELMQIPNVTIVPNTPDILSTYRRTRLLLMPSDYESWGRTATEAMCSGIPVICTPTPGLQENCQGVADYVGHQIESTQPGGPCVDIGTVSDWVKAILEYDNPDYYNKKSLLCKARAKELDPVKELEGLEQFLLNVKSNYKYR